MPRLSAEIEAKSSLGFEIGFGTRQIEIDCQNDVQNASKTTRFSTLKVPTVTWEIPETIFGPDPRAGETDWYTFFYLGFSPADAIAQKTQVGCLCLSEKG